MKKPYIPFLLVFVSFFCACNDEWKEEQFEHLISFKAPLDNKGVSNIFVRYKRDENTVFRLPLIISGSTMIDKDLTVEVGVDSDTLEVLNYERFQNRKDFYYRELESKYFNIPHMVHFKAGESTALMHIDFSFGDIDMTDKWVLPLTVVDNPSNGYTPHWRKHFRKAILRVNPFNDYSGTYSGTALKTVMEGYEEETPIVKNEIVSYVVDENSVFFYAGNIDEERQDRRNYKIYASFNENGSVTLSADNSAINFKVNKDPSYTILERMDAVRPYLLYRSVTINNIDYEFTDYTMVSNIDIRYKVSGTLIMERQLNTQIPDEDQAILW